ncbi:hypothetical protein QO005_004646 [Rhizobium paknamense]|uniref:Uncharacterized protein n=2 Tax=Rhizobium paknamense TaxID=1206817 RepID=A0ABU0IM34_9HYPH|nr:hypothetical protein [Rhizobium paknamense]
MPHYHLEGFESTWRLVRETLASQKFRVSTPNGLELAVDIHYTAGKILTVNIVSAGEVSKATLEPIMNEIARLGLYRGDFAVIDYTISITERIRDGNYSISEELREHRQL